MDGLVQLDLELCKACGVCIELCPEKVFDRDKLGYPVLARPEDCSQCLLCELHCPDFAIEVRRRERRAASKAPAAEGDRLRPDRRTRRRRSRATPSSPRPSAVRRRRRLRPQRRGGLR